MLLRNFPAISDFLQIFFLTFFVSIRVMTLKMSLKDILKTTASHIKKLEKMGLYTVQDLLEYFPRAIESTEVFSRLSSIQLGQKNTLSGILTDFRTEKSPRGKKLGKAALILDDGTTIEVIWFAIPYLLKNLRPDSRVYLVGKVERRYGMLQISNPEVHINRDVHVGGLRAVYSESPPITSKWLREKIAGLLPLVSDFKEFLPMSLVEARGYMKKAQSIREIHAPKDSESWNAARDRLAFEEVFEIQTRVLREKLLRDQKSENYFHVPFDVESLKEDLSTLPFELTVAQKKVLYQILKDFEKSKPAHRLVQGDVGSGKTIVAFLAAAQMVRKGFQVAILAPTEILAEQHFQNAEKFFAKLSFPKGEQESTSLFESGMEVRLLTGSVPAKEKRDIKEKLRTGSLKVLIGTHAILTEDTVFKNLGLAVVDEQHRFGVAQRSLLAENGSHQVAMTATPIPRTLALTIYGDQDISIIDELPPGRKPIITKVISNPASRRKMELFSDDQIGKGRQIFWVCPLVDESDKIEAKNVHDEYERIQNVFHNRRVTFLHGKMKSKEKEAIMDQFKKHEFDILVSTSVIEVGVDIPNATVMVIENAERFGLAQLHQFRGRIGRNDMQSYCLLMTGSSDNPEKAQKRTMRLSAMEKYQSGQKLSEIDLKLRGMGELYGTKQSGLPDFKCADLSNLQMLQDARDWALKILEEDVMLDRYPRLKNRIESADVYF